MAVQRLSDGTSGFDPPWYAFALVGGVLAVDAFRARVSFREGRAARSAALMANAWHFTSDFVGTLAVFAGLVLARAGYPEGDAWAAHLRRRPRARGGLSPGRAERRRPDGPRAGRPGRARIEWRRPVPGVREVRRCGSARPAASLRATSSSASPASPGSSAATTTMDAVEPAVESTSAPARVIVHAEPMTGRERANERVAAAALRVPGVKEVHNITVLEEPRSAA